MRLAQELSAWREGVALRRLAYCARDAGGPAEVFALLAAARIPGGNKRTSPVLEDLRQDFGEVVARLGDPATAGIERADRGASLLREAFGVDVAEIDALNERLGDATEDDLRGFLLDVQQYCSRLLHADVV